MQAVLEMGVEFDLTTLEAPNTTKLENAYGKDLASVINRVRKTNVLQIFDKQSINDNFEENGYDLIVNTHGDIDPYYSDSISKSNAITYCHFPSAKFLIQSEDKTYLDKHLKIGRMALSDPAVATTSADSNNEETAKNSTSEETPRSTINFDRKDYLKWLRDAYDNLIKNSTILTNSQFSRKAILDTYGIEDAIVLSPPVEVEIFRKVGLPSTDTTDTTNSHSIGNDDEREDTILVVSRIDPAKNIDYAISFAKILKENRIGKGMIIAGSLDPYFYGYYNKTRKMVMDLDLGDYVTFETDVSLDKLLNIMGKCKAYFHPRSGEHFGMSIVEAMSAGLIPVVPDIGGQTEFVPSKYQFHDLNQAANITSSIFNKSSHNDRIAISNSVTKFSSSNYKRRFKQVVAGLLARPVD
jgi:hypothetical protein